MAKFIRLDVKQGDAHFEAMINVDAVIGVAPNLKDKQTCWVNTAKFSYLVNEPYEIASARIESMGETYHD